MTLAELLVNRDCPYGGGCRTCPCDGKCEYISVLPEIVVVIVGEVYIAEPYRDETFDGELGNGIVLLQHI